MAVMKFKSVKDEMKWVKKEWGFLVHYKDVGIIVAWDHKKTLYAWTIGHGPSKRLGVMDLVVKPRNIPQALEFAHEWVELLAS